MAKNIDALATKLGAAMVGTVPDYSAGAFGMAALANTLRRRLEPSVGKRPAKMPLNSMSFDRSISPSTPSSKRR